MGEEPDWHAGVIRIHLGRAPKLPRKYDEATFKVYTDEMMKTVCGRKIGGLFQIAVTYNRELVTCKRCQLYVPTEH